MSSNKPILPLHDGKRFAYPSNDPVGSRWDVLRWAVTRKKAKWPRNLTNPAADPVRVRVDNGAMRVSYINHSTVLVQCDGRNIITDPVFSLRVSPVKFAGPKRFRAAGLTLEQLPRIDAVVVSHSHYDHMDIASIKVIAQRDKPLVLVPLGNRKLLWQSAEIDAIELSWWDDHAIDEQTRIHLVPARHWTSRKPGDENMALWGGFVMEFKSGPVYFAGDTGYGNGEHFTAAYKQFGRFRCSLLPIGAYEPRWFMKPQHMNPAEAVKAFADLNTHVALGIHHGTFQLTDEPQDAPVQALKQALLEADINADRFRTLHNGGAWDIDALPAGDQ